ncbi:Ig-like domain-containing protein, partial [Pantoea endophytica]
MPHDWVSADNGEATSNMDDGESAFLMLSGDAAADSAPLFVPEHHSGAWMAMAAFAGLLGLGGIARAMQNQHSGPGESPPPPPQIAMATDVTGIYTGALAHGGVTDDARPQLTGSGSVPGELITVYADGVVIGSTLVAGDGSWTFRPDAALAHGLHTFTTTATAASGLVSEHSPGFDLDVDLIAPARPQVVSADDDAGTLTGALASGSVTDDAQPLFSGQAEPGSLIVFMLDGAVAGSATVAADGSWQWQPDAALPDGPHSFTARATDPAGNTGLPSIPFTFTVDTVIAQPLLETVSDAVTGGVEGAISNDGTGLTNDARPVLSGRAETGSLVTIYDGNSAIGSVRADAATGAWRWQSSENLAEGMHTLTVQATDPAGNVSVISDGFTITVDTLIAPPLLETVTDAVSGGVEGAVSNDGTGLTNDARPLLNGSAEKGSLVTIYDGTTAVGSVYADVSTGAWSWQFTGTDKFEEGPHTLTVQATDPAGNVSVISDSFTITVDTLINQPVLSTITDAVTGGTVGAIANDGTGLTNDARPLLNGTAEKGSLITIYDGINA